MQPAIETAPRPTVRLIVRAGLVPYGEAHGLQRAWVQERKKGLRPDSLVLLEHPPVITLGRNADPSGVLASPERLASLGIEVHRIERGGQATYHGPGQVVGYPILDLRSLRLGVRRYMEHLEEVMIQAAGRFGVEAYRIDGKPGVFCGDGKLGAVGVAVTGGITFHGFAFNVRPDLSHYDLIVPCGLTDVSPTSLQKLGAGATVQEARMALIEAFEDVLGVALAEEPTLVLRDSSQERPLT